MHFDILVEDQSGKKMLEILMPKIKGSADTFTVKSYKGIGTIPKHMKNPKDAANRIFLENLPKLLNGFGRTYYGYGKDYKAVVVVVCDLDDKCFKTFIRQLQNILDNCTKKPDTHFCLAVEEGEAWFLGDIPAIKKAYPKAKDNVLQSYTNDSICGTWEKLADAVYPGGAQALSAKGIHAKGTEKAKWAEDISPCMDLSGNLSPSFQHFIKKIKDCRL